LPRQVNKLEDVNDVLRELFQFMDAYTSRNIDFRQRRVINAHPSIDDYDYVVRKELIDTIGGAVTPRSVTSGTTRSSFDKITFGLGIGRSVEVGDYATPPFIWTNNLSGRPDVVAIAANICPTGASLIVDIKRNGLSIFGPTKLILPSGTSPRTVVHPTGIFDPAVPLFRRYDVFTVHITQIGSIVAGREIEIVIFCNLV